MIPRTSAGDTSRTERLSTLIPSATLERLWLATFPATLATMNREIRFPTQGGRIFFSENFSEIPRKSGGNLPKKGSKIAHFRPSPGGKDGCNGLFWALWAGLWRLLGSGNAGIAPRRKSAVRGFLELLGGCRKNAPLRRGSGAGCGCCCGGLGGAVRFDLGRGKAGTG